MSDIDDRIAAAPLAYRRDAETTIQPARSSLALRRDQPADDPDDPQEPRPAQLADPSGDEDDIVSTTEPRDSSPAC